ncbi:MAG: Minor extracellular protease Epr precursor [Candidatus Heimdallarchaeota archaeon LC_2]|nr:MAG: Minor extracellular protease Epr precursor [Candidatus Heimdallarchaeota archaeon LC_2]
MRLLCLLIIILFVNSFQVSAISGSNSIYVNITSLQTSVTYQSIEVKSSVDIQLQSETSNWNLEMINVSPVWNLTLGSKDIVVAVIDSGITWNNELPKSLRWENGAEINGTDGIDDDENGYIDDYYGFDFSEDTYDNDSSTDTSGFGIHRHGTFVAGIISAQHNEQEIDGIAPNITLMDLRVLDTSNSFSGFDRMYDAIEYAIKMNASVINFSIYFNTRASDNLKEIFQKANEHGIPIVGISGNNGYTRVVAPGSEPTIMAIGATNQDGDVASFTNTGPELELVAPGDDVPSISKEGTLVTHWGTSYAAPHVTGTIALMKSLRDDFQTKYIREILAFTATDLGTPGLDSKSGYGLINASKAVSHWLNFDKDDRDYDQDGLTNLLEMGLNSNIISKDSDGDGMSDDFEFKFELELIIKDGHLDPDNDGYSNLIEYEEGTDPNDSESYPTDYIFPSTEPVIAIPSSQSNYSRVSNEEDSRFGSIFISTFSFLILIIRKRKLD